MSFTKANITVLDLSNVPVPTQPPNAANKQYVDSLVDGVYAAIEGIVGGASAPHNLQSASHPNVDPTAPTVGQVLAWTGSVWKATTVSAGSSGNYLPLSGGTMTGSLSLASDPQLDYQAATKHYVDTQIAAISQSGGGGGETTTYVGSQYINVTGTVISLNTSVTNGTGTLYSAIGHDHDGTYALSAHNHDTTYAALVHNHDGVYSLIGHTHSNYLTTATANSLYAPIGYVPSATSNVAYVTGQAFFSGSPLPIPAGFVAGHCKFLSWSVSSAEPGLVMSTSQYTTGSNIGIICYVVMCAK